ncbi:MAG TPA: ABC transporter ATP-binding protein [Acidimicrobiales bacterium]|nr:ABC transporter ATP-binding protein [Acidimicrobiales bacterium]
MLKRIRSSDEWTFFATLLQAHRSLAYAWWALLVLRGSLPAAFAVATGLLVTAIQDGDPLTTPLLLVGTTFVALQVLSPLHAQAGTILGDDLSAHLNDRLLLGAVTPDGMAHLERPELTDDLTLARDFDLGISGPPMAVNIGFVASGLVEIVVGIASGLVLFGYRWWAAPLAWAAWCSTHWLLRESSIWRDRNTEEVKDAQRHADYTYRLAVDAPAAKELRLFGLDDWTVERFAANRRRLVDLRWEATRLRQQPLRWTVAILVAANGLLFWSLARDAADGRIGLGSIVTFATAALGTSSLAFGGLNWALSWAAQVVVAVRQLEPKMADAGALPDDGTTPAGPQMPAREVRFREVSFAYESSAGRVLDGLDLTIPAGTSLAIVGVNGAGKTTLVKLLCRLYDPTGGTIEVDGFDLRTLDLDSWRQRVTAVFQDFVRYELPLRDNVSPRGDASDDDIRAALVDAGAAHLADLDTVLARGYDGGTDLSGGQWQRVALARALCAVRLGAGLVILDEPTAQLDVRGEAEIFERILAATRQVTTVLISHRFSTVRHADRICVLEHGRVVELGTHDELMAAGGRYRTMFELQASRFADDAGEGEEELDGLALG